MSLEQLRQQEYAQSIVVNRLRREVYSQPDPAASPALLAELAAAERDLKSIEQQRAADEAADPASGRVLDNAKQTNLLGAKTTGLEVTVHLRLAQVPTATCHLLDPADHPLVTCTVRNASNTVRRVRVTAQVENYSAPAVETLELDGLQNGEFNLLPTFFPEKIGPVTELTRATLTIQVDDLDGKLELHRTHPIWLLARTSAPLAVKDPQTGKWVDLTRYLGAFVTPNAPAIMKFLRAAADQHPQKRLVGYQGSEAEIPAQVKAIFDALKGVGEIVYVNSVIDFNPDAGTASQRVRLPRESLDDKEANCIDGTVLFASLLEAASLSPGICLVPGHAFLAWETWQNKGEWRYLETTMIGTHTFEQASASAEATAKAQANGMVLWPLRDLRAKYGVLPME